MTICSLHPSNRFHNESFYERYKRTHQEVSHPANGVQLIVKSKLHMGEKKNPQHQESMHAENSKQNDLFLGKRGLLLILDVLPSERMVCDDVSLSQVVENVLLPVEIPCREPEDDTSNERKHAHHPVVPH